MDLQPKCHEKIRRLMERGVEISNPLTIDIGDDVEIDRISGKGVRIYPGCRIYGATTVISAGCQIGYEAPVTMDGCQLAEDVELRGGFFSKSVFLEKSGMGSGAHVREGCLIEEQAGGAHCVGLKQTILFPFVTLGSLINFCDCLMSGGTDRRNHSEVGSAYIHFNFTPDGDKATPSLIGDVPRGVMLNQPPIFLGGQGGMVGPCQIGFGNVAAAGSILREDYPEEGRLIFCAPPARSFKIRRRPAAYPDFKSIVEKNILYLANLKALAAWYEGVRKPFFERREFGALIFAEALELIARACRERLERLRQMAHKAGQAAPAGSDAARFRHELEASLPEVALLLETRAPGDDVAQAREEFLGLIFDVAGAASWSYLDTIRNLSRETAAFGVSWLAGLVGFYCRHAAAAVPCLELFQSSNAKMDTRNG